MPTGVSGPFSLIFLFWAIRPRHDVAQSGTGRGFWTPSLSVVWKPTGLCLSLRPGLVIEIGVRIALGFGQQCATFIAVVLGRWPANRRKTSFWYSRTDATGRKRRSLNYRYAFSRAIWLVGIKKLGTQTDAGLSAREQDRRYGMCSGWKLGRQTRGNMVEPVRMRRRFCEAVRWLLLNSELLCWRLLKRY